MTDTGLKRLISVFGVRVPDGSQLKVPLGHFFIILKKSVIIFLNALASLMGYLTYAYKGLTLMPVSSAYR